MQQNYLEYGDSCSNVIHQTVDVGLPISIVPDIHLGSVKIMCSGEPRLECCSRADGSGGLELRITQTVTYKIPLEYSTKVTAGEVTSECGRECKKTPLSTSCTQCRH